MQLQVITLFPQMFDAITCGGVTSRALDSGLLQLELWNPRDFAADSHRTVDDRPYGGGPGMVMMFTPLKLAIDKAREQLKKKSGIEAKVIYLSPQGRRLDQPSLRELIQRQAMILVCGRYEAVDERLLETEIDEQWSIGDYVLSGGELPAMVFIDGLARLIPGTLGHEESAQQDSFSQGLLDCPHYTRPGEVAGLSVPEVLLSGDHQAIERWRQKQALGSTWVNRPDLLDVTQLDEEQQDLLKEFQQEYESS
jgi:tRNA (guanine37-N1)-methyltransferase